MMTLELWQGAHTVRDWLGLAQIEQRSGSAAMQQWCGGGGAAGAGSLPY